MRCIDCSPFLRRSGRMRIAAGPILLIGYTALLPLLAGKLTPLAASIWTSNTPQRTELTTAPPLAPSSHGPAILGPATRASEGLAARLCIGMAGVSTQPSATVRAPPAPSRSWHTMDTSVVYNLCFDILVLYVTIESTSSAPHHHCIRDPGLATTQHIPRGACTRGPPGSFANYAGHHAPEYAVGGSHSHALLAGSHPLFP